MYVFCFKEISPDPTKDKNKQNRFMKFFGVKDTFQDYNPPKVTDHITSHFIEDTTLYSTQRHSPHRTTLRGTVSARTGVT